jgi:cytochrome P450
MIYECLRQPTILSQALDEVLTSQSWISLNINPKMNVEPLCNMPLLQSMYAETLRLYTSLFTLRSAPYGDLTVCNLTIPKDELIAVDSRVSAMDSSFWNTRATNTDYEGEYPVNHYWAERFLVYPNDPTSGPLRFNASKPRVPAPDVSSHITGSEPHFTMDGLAGAWLPYGGGNRQCPGRNFAKNEIILGFAIVLSMLDVELLDSDNVEPRKPDLKFYGLGTLPPKGKVPFRVRRRD